ncbi:hypothetical protein ACJ41O_011583 [Fusarium nematophilum]
MPPLRSSSTSNRRNPLDTRLKRRPLQELPVSSNGSLSCRRRRTIRPLPSTDKENLRALIQALEHLHITIRERISRFQVLLRVFQEHHRRIRALRRSFDVSTRHNSVVVNTFSAAQPTDHPRLSMPLLDSDDSGSEPDLSVLGMARPGVPAAAPQISSPYDGGAAEEEVDQDEDEALSPEQYEAEDTSIEEEEGPADDAQDVIPLIDPATAGLKEISNLARFTVSSHKPGNGVEELKSDDLKSYWQSDGPQPHKLTMYFTKRVPIRDIRFYVDYNEDESYTPTKVVFKAGTNENQLIEFATMALDNPVGWQQVPVAGAGGDPDGNTLVAWVLQMQILENHQNGKDTHLRGIKIYSFDNDSALGPGRDGSNPVSDIVGLVEGALSIGEGGSAAAGTARARVSSVRREAAAARFEPGEGGLTIPDFMREPEIR